MDGETPNMISALAEGIARAIQRLNENPCEYESVVEAVARYVRAFRTGARDARVRSTACRVTHVCHSALYREHEEAICKISASADDEALVNEVFTPGTPLSRAIEGVYVMSKAMRGELTPGGWIGVGTAALTRDNECPCWRTLRGKCQPLAPR